MTGKRRTGFDVAAVESDFHGSGIGAEGGRDSALAEWQIPHNASKVS